MFDEEEFVNKTLIQTYVWHGNTCFFVSTINRRCSSMIGGVYAETFVFEWDDVNRKKGDIIAQHEAGMDSIYFHQKMVEWLYATGKCTVDEPDDE